MFTELQKQKETLRQFALGVTREVGVRRGDFSPRDAMEKRWRLAGPVDPTELDSVQSPCHVYYGKYEDLGA